MRCWKFSQKTKLKQKFLAISEKEVGNFFQDWDHSDLVVLRAGFTEFHKHFQKLLVIGGGGGGGGKGTPTPPFIL